MTAKPEFETEHTDEPVCPYCGSKVHDWWDCDLNPDKSNGITCDRCEEDFTVYAHVTWTFSTRKGWEP